MRFASVQHISPSLCCTLGPKLTFTNFAGLPICNNFLFSQQLFKCAVNDGETTLTAL